MNTKRHQMKTAHLFAFLGSLLFSSCITIHEGSGPESSTNETAMDHQQVILENEATLRNVSSLEPNQEKEGFFERLAQKPLKTHEFRDARTGMVVNSAQYPSNWNVISRPIYTMDQKLPLFLTQIEGPNGLKTFNTPLKFYLYYQNPQMNEYMRQSPMSSMLRLETNSRQLMKEEVHTRMQKSGFTLIGEKSMPRAEKYVRNEINKSGIQNVTMDLLATEWKGNNGQRALVTISKISMVQPLLNDAMTGWFYGIDYVFVDENHFEPVLNQLMDALESTKENSQWKQYVTQLNQQRNQERMRQSQIAHNNRMAARQASFNAHQKKMQGIWAAQDANHASFMNRNFGSGSNTTQQNFVNMINEKETVYNPLNGKNYQVNAFSTQNWMDSDGNLIQNDDLFYTPNGDINLNNREWVKVKSAY